MILATRPIRFVLGMVALWAGARAWMLWPGDAGSPPPAFDSVRSISAPFPIVERTRFAEQALRAGEGRGLSRQASKHALMWRERRGLSLRLGGEVGSTADAEARNVASPASADSPAASEHRPIIPPAPAALAPVRGPSRWSGSAWAFIHGGGQNGLASFGQLGGSQAGARILFRPAAELPLAIAMRVSRPIEDKGAEAAIGVDWQPAPAIRFAVERRIRIERGGRDAWSAFAAGGVYDRRIAGLRLDGYAQAGIVGARSRDLFADGALRIGREFGPVTIGAGAWGAAQPRVERFDLGPSAVARLPVPGATISAAIDWRFRVAGDARPGSGPALTIGVDF